MQCFRISAVLWIFLLVTLVPGDAFFRKGGRAKNFPHDMTRKSDLNRLYNSRVIHAERVRRPLGNLPVAIGPLSHSGVRVTLDNGKKYLIHKGSGFGRTSQTVVVDANHMSNRWKASIPNNTQYRWLNVCVLYR
ncbi:hypothetical protein EOD39_21366 [Acipenser ruthenus]|uniref:Uncharacterized protein n=1 Tax=Acipenser ruthenus TaxID=7906 RepID=A0A444USV8_ACIRT|nr:hypothetical protein EOD39_21366 [Acipenser ruthenus]